MTDTTTAPTVYELDIPLCRNKPPLTANQRLHWREKARRTRMVREITRIRARQAGIQPCARITVQLHYRPGDNRRRDAPNLHATAKPAVDGLVDAGLVPDDTGEYVTEVMPVIHPGPGNRRLWLTVEVTR
ncbi:crossover junction endodeoxyribonuclease RusA [Kibdelosporangium banguiense]|uniref:Crossover junction endodeoxyribonuclease RusA n=1 Tax=Kibdelosporangium banguiense TaxID=1365924 RepID=A0ABS4U3M2_9PSEU|nr:hypothetical protein [Kibdelosporangium banguiense]MBP2331251.1 crossover junction endodeoxyribonuclease RusA [Kibdelosporangium banguiense]